MRITCPHCGPRGHEEFVYLGDATRRRPTTAAVDTVEREAWNDYIYLRDNPAGPQRELWQHSGGCRVWLVVTRNTQSHEILGVEPARPTAPHADAAPPGHLP